MTAPKPNQVYDNPDAYWDFVTVTTDVDLVLVQIVLQCESANSQPFEFVGLYRSTLRQEWAFAP